MSPLGYAQRCCRFSLVVKERDRQTPVFMDEKRHICFPDGDWREPGSLYPSNPKNPQVFFEITIDEKNVGKIVMELFNDITPNCAMNFLALCTGDYGIGKIYKKNLHLKGTCFFRIVPQYMAQGGDIVNGNGTGGECIWGERFPDENFLRKHIGCGIMSYVSKGRHTNASQFFFSLGECPWLDGQYVVFGQVLKGFDILQTMAKEAGSISGRTKKQVIIVDCGAFNASEDNQALLQASMLFASKSISKIATSAPTKASDKDEGQKQSKQEELSSSQKETKDTKVLVRKSLEVKKAPMVSQSLEDYNDDGSSGSTYVFGQLRTLQFQ